MAGKNSRLKFVVRHSNLLQPEDYYRFIHFDGFTSDWKDLDLGDDELSQLEIQIMISPQQGPVIPGCGGIRKMRFSPASWHRGRRGAVRVLYAVFPDYSIAVLGAAFAKSEQENISADDRRSLKALVREIKSVLDRGGSNQSVSRKDGLYGDKG